MIPNNTIIESTLDGKSVKLILSENILLPSRECTLTLKLPPAFHDWVIELVFVDDTLDGKSGVSKRIFDKKTNKKVTVTMYSWIGELQSVKPHHFYSTDNRTNIYMSVGTTANIESDLRKVQVSIWELIK